MTEICENKKYFFNQSINSVNNDWMEDETFNTFDNIDNAIALLGNEIEQIHNIVIVTSEFHLKRCNAILKRKYPNLITSLVAVKEKNYTLVIASTTRRKNMDIYCNENINIINKANIKDYFSIVYTREDAKEIKPNPEIYLRIVNELKVRKDECLIFEDSLIGIDAANNAEIEAVAMYDKYSDMEREEIEKKATYSFNNYREVIQNLLKENL